MYKFPHFTESDAAAIVDFMQAHPFVTLIAYDGQQSQATQVPVLIEEREGTVFLKGHVFKHSDHYPALQNSAEMLVLFTGPHCYVSASWYTKRGQGSTWNYMSVQARGKARWFADEETRQLLADLTHKYEDGQQRPELLEDMPEDYVSANLKAIAGFEIEVWQLDATFKLSQNRDDETYKNIVAQLMASDDIDSISIAGQMMQRKPHLFE